MLIVDRLVDWFERDSKVHLGYGSAVHGGCDTLPVAYRYDEQQPLPAEVDSFEIRYLQPSIKRDFRSTLLFNT